MDDRMNGRCAIRLRAQLLALGNKKPAFGSGAEFLLAGYRSFPSSLCTEGLTAAGFKLLSNRCGGLMHPPCKCHPWPANDGNQFDTESLGKNPNAIQFNAMVYTGARPPTSKPVSPTQEPSLQQLGFDSSQYFHVYTIEWTPKEATFLIDDLVYHCWNSRINLIGLPQNVLLTIWASNSPSWAGPVTSETVNAKAVYDWVEVWRYTP